MHSGFRLDQLRGDSYLSVGLAHTAFEDVADTKLEPDLFHVDRLALVGETRIAGDYKEPADAAECGDDLLDHAVGEVFLFRVAAHVREGQHRNRRLVRESGTATRGRGGRSNSRRDHAIYADRPCDVLQRLLAAILESEVEPARRVLLNPRRDADAA